MTCKVDRRVQSFVAPEVSASAHGEHVGGQVDDDGELDVR